MQDINKFINETDTDNITLNKLKELGTKLTGQDNVQGETIADVLDFIKNNYSGGGSKTTLYIKDSTEVVQGVYAYKDENFTTKVNADELYNACKQGCVFKMGIYGEYTPLKYICITDDNGVKISEVDIYYDTIKYVYSSEFDPGEPM